MVSTQSADQPEQRVLAALADLGVTDAVAPVLQDADRARLHERVALALGQQDYGAAVEDAWLLAYDNPWDREAAIALATCLHHLGDLPSACRHYAIALLLDEDDAYCAYRLGECLGALGMLDEAREAFESAVELSWKDPACHEVREHAQRRLQEMGATEDGA